jgi:hypothetical protein
MMMHRTLRSRRARAAISVVTAAVLVCGMLAAPTAADSAPTRSQAALRAGQISPAERAALMNAVPGHLLLAPRPDTLVRQLPARVTIRVPQGTTRLWARLGSRDVTGRFIRARGSLRVAHLSLRDGLHYGPNTLIVLAQRNGRRPVAESRSFVVGRRDNGFVRLRVRPGPVTALRVQVGPRLAPGEFGQPGLGARLAVIERERTVRLWLNGRSVTRTVGRSHPTRWTASLSATHGVRYGVNRLRMLVFEPDTGRYALLRRRFVVRPNHVLAGAGRNVATRVGDRVRLDGRDSDAPGRARVHDRWHVLAEPQGSHATLRRARSARPLLTPDRPGRYVVGLTATSGKAGATATRAAPSEDLMTVTAAPRSLLVAFEGLTHQDGRAGIKVGNNFYPNPSPDGHTYTQRLVLDRTTLTPIENTWFDGSAGGDHGVGALTAALSNGSLNQLVILSHPQSHTPDRPVEPGQVKAFNDAMKMIGVGPIDPDRFAEWGQKLVIEGVPSSGAGSGYYTHGGDPDGLKGWLMPDATNRFRFQSERPPFDTSSSATATTNTLTIREQHVEASLPAGATGGFQVAVVDPIDFRPLDNAVFVSNQPGEDQEKSGAYQAVLSGLTAMAKFLNDHAPTRFHLAVQSIGHVALPPAPANPYDAPVLRNAWQKVTLALAGYGANPDTFNTVDGSYAFLGGSWLSRSEVAQSSSAFVTDPTTTPPTRESGTLSGRASMNPDGNFKPVAADSSGSFDSRLYDKAFRAPTPWPYTAAAGDPNALQYAKALRDITAALPRLRGYYPDLRQAYVANANLTYGDMKGDLERMPYPGDGYTCTDDAGRIRKYPGYTRRQFCNLSTELQHEFDWLDATNTLFDSYEKAFNRSGAKQGVDLQTIGDTISTAVKPDSAAEQGWSVGAFLGNLISALLLAFNPEGTAVLAAWEALVTGYELVRELVGNGNGAPVGDQITTKVKDMSADVANRLFDTANALDRLREVIVSDYGRLEALGSVADGPGWAIDVPDTATSLSIGAKANFSAQLVPIAFGIYFLSPTAYSSNPTADDCFVMGYGKTFRGAPASAQLQWHGNYPGSADLWVLGQHDLSARHYAFPPADVTDPMFHPISKNGYGMQLSTFAWQQYEDVRGAPPTDISYCH